MAFTYDFTLAPAIAYVRLLVADTDSTNPIFSDEEITAFYTIQSSMAQSGPARSSPSTTLPSTPVSYLRVAALALDTLASNRSRLASVVQILDVRVSPSAAAQSLHKQAESFREIEDNAGAFAIIEQCSTTWAFADRWWKQIQRLSGGAA